MSTLDTMDIQAAIIAHLNWQSKLVDFFYGVENLNPGDVPDHTRCDFGKWLYDQEGMQHLAAFPEVHAMEKLHQDVHESIKKILNTSKEQRMSEDGKKILQSFKDTCNRFIEILEKMEREAKKS